MRVKISNKSDRQKLNHLLSCNENIFMPGGPPTTFAIHEIETGEQEPI